MMSRALLRRVAAMSSAAAIALSIPAEAAGTLKVPSQFPTIQDAMFAATDGDVVLVADGVYKGPGNKGLFHTGMDYSVRSENGPDHCIIDCEGSGTAFFLVADEPESAVVEGFTIRGGSGSSGGAVFLHHDSDLTFRDCVFRDNFGGIGGAVYAENSSSATFVDCTFVDNSSTNGGAIYLADGSDLTFVNCTIADNVATTSGGGVFVSTFGTTSRLIGCVITGNTAGSDGGGIYAAWGGLDVSSCTIAGNAASGRGGGLAARGPSAPRIQNSILWGNGAFAGGQLALLEGAAAAAADVKASFTDLEGGEPAVLVEPGSVLTLGGGMIDADPLFSDLATGDVRIAADSPAADAGRNASVPADGADVDGDGDLAEPLPLDAGGLPRFTDASAPDTGLGAAPVVDMGAHEQQSLSADLPGVSLFSGGTQALTLSAGPSFAGLPYFLLGTASGTSPAVPIDGVLLPLTIDAYTLFTVEHANTQTLTSTFAVLDAKGEATASLNVAAGTTPALAGTLLHHAYLVFDVPGTFEAVLASNAVALELTP